jgi:hypothetical protein
VERGLEQVAQSDESLVRSRGLALTNTSALDGAVNGSHGPGQGAVYGSPTVSSTGELVAFIWSPAYYDQTSDPSLNINELRVIDVASGTVTTLASWSGVNDIGVLTFSPVGDRILFSRSDSTDVGTSLWSVNTDGSGAQLLVTGTGWGDWQALPDGP